MDRTAQDWPWDPGADEASLGVCIAGLCGLTLGWSTDLVPTAQTGLSPCLPRASAVWACVR